MTKHAISLSPSHVRTSVLTVYTRERMYRKSARCSLPFVVCTSATARGCYSFVHLAKLCASRMQCCTGLRVVENNGSVLVHVPCERTSTRSHTTFSPRVTSMMCFARLLRDCGGRDCVVGSQRPAACFCAATNRRQRAAYGSDRNVSFFFCFASGHFFATDTSGGGCAAAMYNPAFDLRSERDTKEVHSTESCAGDCFLSGVHTLLSFGQFAECGAPTMKPPHSNQRRSSLSSLSTKLQSALQVLAWKGKLWFCIADYIRILAKTGTMYFQANTRRSGKWWWEERWFSSLMNMSFCFSLGFPERPLLGHPQRVILSSWCVAPRLRVCECKPRGTSQNGCGLASRVSDAMSVNRRWPTVTHQMSMVVVVTRVTSAFFSACPHRSCPGTFCRTSVTPCGGCGWAWPFLSKSKISTTSPDYTGPAMRTRPSEERDIIICLELEWQRAAE